MPDRPVSESEYDAQREAMVANQIEMRGITDPRVLAAMRAVPRHCFVPEYQTKSAYRDSPLPIGQGQTISQPYIVALVTAELGLTGAEKVLEIGTGAGYQAAILGQLAREVITVERLSGLAKEAEALLAELGYDNVQVKVGDGTLGWPESAPYDAIMVTAAAPEVPEPLRWQLADGGCLLAPRARCTRRCSHSGLWTWCATRWWARATFRRDAWINTSTHSTSAIWRQGESRPSPLKS